MGNEDGRKGQGGNAFNAGNPAFGPRPRYESIVVTPEAKDKVFAELLQISLVRAEVLRGEQTQVLGRKDTLAERLLAKARSRIWGVIGEPDERFRKPSRKEREVNRLKMERNRELGIADAVNRRDEGRVIKYLIENITEAAKKIANGQGDQLDLEQRREQYEGILGRINPNAARDLYKRLEKYDQKVP